MKNLRRLCSPLLKPLESGDGQYRYQKSHRVVLAIVSILFMSLAAIVFLFLPEGDYSYLLPVILFGGAGLMGLIICTLGNDRAVARIWGSR